MHDVAFALHSRVGAASYLAPLMQPRHDASSIAPPRLCARFLGTALRRRRLALAALAALFRLLFLFGLAQRRQVVDNFRLPQREALEVFVLAPHKEEREAHASCHLLTLPL